MQQEESIMASVNAETMPTRRRPRRAGLLSGLAVAVFIAAVGFDTAVVPIGSEADQREAGFSPVAFGNEQFPRIRDYILDLVEATRLHAPRYVIAGDYDGDNYAEINDLADRLRPHAHRVIVVPHKPGEVDRVPAWAIVGYSSPTQYAGTDAPVWEYRGRDIHVLGGTIKQSIEIQRYLGDSVVSFDCNSFHRSATQFGKWWGGSSPHWNHTPNAPAASNAVEAYRNTMLNISYQLRESGIVDRDTDTPCEVDQ